MKFLSKGLLVAAISFMSCFAYAEGNIDAGAEHHAEVTAAASHPDAEQGTDAAASAGVEGADSAR